MVRRILHALAHLFGANRFYTSARTINGVPVIRYGCLDCDRFDPLSLMDRRWLSTRCRPGRWVSVVIRGGWMASPRGVGRPVALHAPDIRAGIDGNHQKEGRKMFPKRHR